MRKLIYFFGMILGAAFIVNTIFISPRRFYNHDNSAFYALIILSVLTIIASTWQITREPVKLQLSEPDKVFLRVFRIVNILAILVCFTFVVIMNFLTDHYPYAMLRNVYFLIIPAAVSIILAALSLKVYPPVRVWGTVMTLIALVLAGAISFFYLNYMPKFLLNDGINTLRSDTEFSQKDVYYPINFRNELDKSIYFESFNYNYSGYNPYFYPAEELHGRVYIDPFNDQIFGANPFFYPLYNYSCDSYGYDESGLHVVKGCIIFNPATGEYKYTNKQELRLSAEGRPELSWNYIHDKDLKHSDVFNLFFRDWSVWKHTGASAKEGNPMLAVSSDEWTSRIKDVLYPHSFPEDEARAYLKSMGDEAFKTILLEEINELNSEFIDKTIEVYFFGIDIATYQNGEIVLRL